MKIKEKGLRGAKGGSEGVLDLLFGNQKLIIFLLVLTAVIVLFLSIVVVSEMPLRSNEKSHHAQVSPRPGDLPVEKSVDAGSGLLDNYWLEVVVRISLVLLVAVLLYIPIAWITQFSRISIEINSMDGESRSGMSSDNEVRREFLGWLTAVSVPYLVMGFAMVVELRAVMEERTQGIGAIAAIMILYALSVLASFLYIEIRELRFGFTNQVRMVTRWYGNVLKLSNSLGTGNPANAAEQLLDKWAEFLTGKNMDSSVKHSSVKQNLLGTLLTSYMKEEADNICGNLESERTPSWVAAVRSAAENRVDGGVAFLATHFGFYARYLAKAVRGLFSELGKDESVVLATITYVLPPFWWNWPYSKDEHAIYGPVEEFRKTLGELAEHGAANGGSFKVFRRMLVRDEEDGDLADGAIQDLYKVTFASKSSWDEMSKWNVWLSGVDRSPLDSESSVRPAVECVREVQWASSHKQKENPRKVYWITKEKPAKPDGACSPELLLNYYSEIMHLGKHGRSQACHIKFSDFVSGFQLGQSQNGNLKPGLNGCTEITFLGKCKRGCVDIWCKDAKPDLGLAFLSNMNKDGDAIFLAVVLSNELIVQLWESVKVTLKDKEFWDSLDPAKGRSAEH